MVDAAIEFLAVHGAMLVCGVTALLLVVGMAVALCARRSAVLRQRGCEMGVLAALVWLVLACVPVPRGGWGGGEGGRGVGGGGEGGGGGGSGCGRCSGGACAPRRVRFDIGDSGGVDCQAASGGCGGS